MIECKFDESMLNDIKGIIGAKLLSFELDEDNIVENRAFGLIKINTPVYAINILNELCEVNYVGTPEDISCFSCEKVAMGTPFVPYCLTAKSKKIMVMDDIIEISIVSDKISIPCKEYEISFDIAIVIKTQNHSYIIYRDCDFMETMYLKFDKSIDEVCPLQKTISNWEETGWKISVTRTITEL